LLAYNNNNHNVVIRNLTTGTIKSNTNQIDSFVLSHNGKYVLLHKYNKSCIISISSFFKMDFENLKWSSDAFGPYKILWGTNKSLTPYVNNIKIINLESGAEKEIIVGNRKISFDNDFLYLITNNLVIVVDSLFDVIEIQNEYDIIGFSITHHVFVNKSYHLFRIVNGKFTKYVMQYDFWSDNNIPKTVHDKVEILVDLELFPSELINEIYRQLILCNNEIVTVSL